MRNSMLLFFLFLLLPIAVLGHDGYVAYNRPQLGDVLHAFRLSDVGWIWVTYSKDSYDWARENISQGFWDNFLNPVLMTYSVIVASLPLAILIIVKIVHKVFSSVKMVAVTGGRGKGKFSPANPLEKKSAPVKYKRR